MRLLLVLLAGAAPLPSGAQTPTRVAQPTDLGRISTTDTKLMQVTAYCPCRICCGPNARGTTASGQRVSYHNRAFVAADTSLLPFYSEVIVPGYNHGRPVPVIDRGKMIIGHRLDVFFPTHQQAARWGRQILPVKLVSGAEAR